MYKNTSKRNPVASDVYHMKSGDKKKIKLESVHQRKILSCTNTAVQNFIKLNKQNTQQYTDLVELGEIYL